MAKLTPPVSSKDHAQGTAHAQVSLVEYGDFQCSYCGRAYPIVKRLQKHFGKELLFIFRNFPLSELHEFAMAAAIAAEAAGKQHKFWEMHDIIYERQDQLSNEALVDFAQELGLDMEVFSRDCGDEAVTSKVDADFESGVRSGVNGTPSFFINGHQHNADFDFETLAAAIQKASLLRTPG